MPREPGAKKPFKNPGTLVPGFGKILSLKLQASFLLLPPPFKPSLPFLSIFPLLPLPLPLFTRRISPKIAQSVLPSSPAFLNYPSLSSSPTFQTISPFLPLPEKWNFCAKLRTFSDAWTEGRRRRKREESPLIDSE